MSVISNFIVISLFLDELRSNLVWEVKIKKNTANIYTAQKLIFFIICYKRENFDSDFGHSLAKHVLSGYHGNSLGPGDQNVFEMMCNRLTIKVTKFQQSSANRF